MTPEIGFIGDVHGSTATLQRLVERVAPLLQELVFLGDYVNRGPDSAGAIDYLIGLRRCGLKCTFLEGNHDRAFRDFLDGGRIAPFLAIGGARTITSYLDRVETDVEVQFRQAVPEAHREFLTSLRPHFLLRGKVFACHQPSDPPSGEFCVHGHHPQPGGVPLVTTDRALIDTGCGIDPKSPLTCFCYPSRTWVQSV